MIQLKVWHPRIRNSGHVPNMICPVITQLHRQLRRLSRRVRQRPEEEAGRDNRSVPRRRRALD